MTALAGKRILVVEDEFIIAQMAADMLADLGATIVGPANTIAKALDLAENDPIDVAVLDINMNGERSDAVAALLSDRKIPFVYTTGYGDDAVRDGPASSVVDKPYTQDHLESALVGVLSQTK